MSGTAPNELHKMCICCHEQFTGAIVTCPNDGTTLTDIQTENLVGTVFADKYEILDIIGGGGMGMVYRAKHRLMNRIVAIKVLHKTNVASSDALKRFQIEARAASALSMPNILTVYDFGVSPHGQPYMVMDYLDGRSLADIIEAEGRLPLSRALNIFIQICNAMEHAHEKGILHRDLKPSNIVLVTFEGKPDYVKIVDFGIAKLLNPSDQDSANLTKTGEVFGSPLYMSPEQWKGQKLDCRTDVYSIGSVMYRSLTGEPIFEPTDVLQLMYQQVHETPRSFESLGVSLPTEIEQIVLKAVAKDPAERFQSMQQLMDALIEFKNSTTGETLETASQASPSILPSEETRTLVSLNTDRSNSIEQTASNAAVVTAPDVVPQPVASTAEAKPTNSVSIKTISILSGLGALLIAGGAIVMSFMHPHSSPVQNPPNSPDRKQPLEQQPAVIDKHVQYIYPKGSPEVPLPSPSTYPVHEINARSQIAPPHPPKHPAKKSHPHPIGGLKNAIRHLLNKL